MPRAPLTARRATLHLRAHRDARALTVWQLSDASGVPRMTIYRLERPTARGIDFATLGALAHALGLAPGALFAPPEPERPERPEKPPPKKSATKRAAKKRGAVMRPPRA